MQIDADPDRDDLPVSHDINVTPFIDVVLVLLIIFMIAAPLSTVDVPVDLPAFSSQVEQRPDKPVYLTVRPDLTLTVDETPVVRDALAGALDAATEGNHDVRLYLRADKSIRYGDLVDIMDAVRASGYLKVALVGMDRAE